MSASIPQIVTDASRQPSNFGVQEHHTLIGKTLGNRYRILREIGSGGMAWVYLAEDIKDNELVAVKVLYPQFGEDLSYIQRFNREAKLASTLTDPHIVRVLDYGADRDVYYLVMEYIEGQNLREVLTDKAHFQWREALEIIDQLATALEHAHPHGVVHRDIKPQNMMLTDTGLLKVLDFGIARIPTLPSLTQSGFIGSPYYVSPEQAMGEDVDIRSDIYSSGIVLYELLSGKIPFEAKSPWSIISQHITNEPPPIELDEDEVPEPVHQLLSTMIAKRPEDRFPTPTALRRTVTSILAGQGIPDSALLDTQPIAAPDRVAMADSLYQRAMTAMGVEEWGRAVDLLNQALNLAPDHPEASEKFTLAEQKTFLVSLYNSAKRAIRNEIWEEAVNNLNGVLELDPDYKDAKALIEETRRALEEEDARQFVITRYNEGVAHLEAGRWPSAIEAFQEVRRHSPGYEQVDELLAQAQRLNNPSLGDRLNQFAGNFASRGNWWRWGLITAVIALIFSLFLVLSDGDPVAGNDDDAERLKTLYEQAQQAMTNGETEQAVVFLDQILAEDPDYADAITIRRELLATPTLTPAPTPTPTPTLGQHPLTGALAEAQEAVETEQWVKAIDTLDTMRQTDAEYEKARITSLYCDAYVGRGLETLANIDPEAQEEAIKAALADFQAGAAECPRRTDLQDQAERTAAYLEVINTPLDDRDSIIEALTPIVAADPDYADDLARNLLYVTHLERGDNRRQASEIVGALSDFEAALALKVDDPSVAREHRAELLVALSQQADSSHLTSELIGIDLGNATSDEEASDQSPTPPLVPIRFAAPEIIAPEDDASFAGRLTDVIVEWEPLGALAEDEYYDLTVMHIFANEPTYWGLATKETQIQLTPSYIGVGEAGGDRFYWWVTARKANTAPARESLDLPVSEQSRVGTFIWTR